MPERYREWVWRFSFPSRNGKRHTQSNIGPLRAARAGALCRAARRLADFGLFAALEAVAAALHGCDELREVDLERVEDVVRVVLDAEADLALAGAGVLDDLVGLAL